MSLVWVGTNYKFTNWLCFGLLIYNTVNISIYVQNNGFIMVFVTIDCRFVTMD